MSATEPLSTQMPGVSDEQYFAFEDTRLRIEAAPGGEYEMDIIPSTGLLEDPVTSQGVMDAVALAGCVMVDGHIYRGGRTQAE